MNLVNLLGITQGWAWVIISVITFVVVLWGVVHYSHTPALSPFFKKKHRYINNERKQKIITRFLSHPPYAQIFNAPPGLARIDHRYTIYQRIQSSNGHYADDLIKDIINALDAPSYEDLLK